MLSILLTPLLLLLSVFGLYSLPPQHLPLRPSVARPATPAVVNAETSTTTPAQKPAVVVVEKKETKIEPEKILAPPLATPPKPSVDFAADTESRILVLTNAERANGSRSSLSADAQLTALARVHSADMLAREYFDHDDPDGCSSSCRANKTGYAWSAIGENIYMTDGYELSSEKEAAMVVAGWMHSSGHRANILRAEYTHAGVGVAVAGEKVYITAVYAKPR